MDDPRAVAAGLRFVGRWTWVLIVAGSAAWELDGGRFSPGAGIGLAGVSLGLWRLSRSDELAKRPLITAAVATGVAGACSVGPVVGRPVGPVLVAVGVMAGAIGLWAALAGFVHLARQLPPIRRMFLGIRKRLRLAAAVGAVLLAGYKGWELGGGRPVAAPVAVTWTAASLVALVAFLALELWTFRAFMALREAAEMAVERGGPPGGGDVAPRGDQPERTG